MPASWAKALAPTMALLGCTAKPVTAETSLDADTVEDRLLTLITQGFGDFEPAESGTIVYTFYDMGEQREQEAG